MRFVSIGLFVACFVSLCGCQDHVRDVGARAASDLPCPRNLVRVEETANGDYVAHGCGLRLYYKCKLDSASGADVCAPEPAPQGDGARDVHGSLHRDRRE